MKRVMLVLLAGSLAAYAANISGKVAAGKGSSVVYVDAVAGKTFPAPASLPFPSRSNSRANGARC